MRDRFDYLVIGSGVAGLSFALRAAAHGTVCVVTKKESAESNTNYAQGGIAAVMDPEDTVEEHVQDTLVAGAGLCHEDVVRMVVEEGPERIRDLIDLGAQFDRDPDGDLHLGREGGHSADRIVHAEDMTGREVERALLAAVRRSPNITVLEYHYAVNLLTEHQLGEETAPGDALHCFGAYVLDSQTGVVHTVLAKATLLAAGGAGQVYQHTTNPTVATGDGIAMAYRAKAVVANMEFIQFHPTSLYLPGADFDGRSFLITEAVRGDGGILTNLAGERFMPAYDEREELAPRDVVARAIDDQMKKRGDDHVWLDISHKDADAILGHFPNIQETLLQHGLDMTAGTTGRGGRRSAGCSGAARSRARGSTAPTGSRPTRSLRPSSTPRTPSPRPGPTPRRPRGRTGSRTGTSRTRRTRASGSSWRTTARSSGA